jgi:hypothetical protein
MKALRRAAVLGGCLLALPSSSLAATAPASAETTAPTTQATTHATSAASTEAVAASRLRTNPATLARLEATNRILAKELAIIERLNDPRRLSAKVGARFMAQLGATTTAVGPSSDSGVRQRFESAVAVPSECSEACKAKWKTLSEVYGKYFACRPSCEEDILREKTAASEGVDDECMKEQKCWEKIEEVVFTKPGGAAAETAAVASGASGWAIERCSQCCANGRATKSTSYKEGKKKKSCKTGNTYSFYGEKNYVERMCCELRRWQPSVSLERSGSEQSGTSRVIRVGWRRVRNGQKARRTRSGPAARGCGA